MKTIIHSHIIDSPCGELLVAATSKGLCLLEYVGLVRVEEQISRIEQRFNTLIKPGDSAFFEPMEKQLIAYFLGELTVFDLPLDLRGTEFQLESWYALMNIPYGQTLSYQQQAKLINRPAAVRAVANANRLNPISIIIPCHRVIGKSGALTGYGGGLPRKQFLLDLETNSRI